MSSCVVPGCRNQLQEWTASFPADPLLQTRWKHCIELGAGAELPPELDASEAVVCSLHFLQFCPELLTIQQEQNSLTGEHRLPTLFFREDLMVETESCCLCTQICLKGDMLEKDSCLTKGLTLGGIVKMVLGDTFFDDEKTSEYVCEMCTTKVDVLLTIYKHWEAGQLVWKTLHYKHGVEKVRFRRNTEHAVEPTNGNKAREKNGKVIARSKRPKRVVSKPEVPSNPLESIIKVEEAVLQEVPQPVQLVVGQSDKDKGTLTVFQENPDASAAKVVVAKMTKAEMLDEAKRICYLCDEILGSSNLLLTHLIMSHVDQETWKCQECNLQFKGSVELNNHLKMHDAKRRRFKCEYCPLRFTNNATKQYHFSKVHSRWNRAMLSTNVTQSATQGTLSIGQTKPTEQIALKTIFLQNSIVVEENMESHRNESPPVLKTPSTPPAVNNDLSNEKINGVATVQKLVDLPPLVPTTLAKRRPTRTRKSRRHPTGTFACCICISRKFPTPGALVKHFTRTHRHRTLEHFRCRFCDDIHLSRETLAVHVASHRGKYECTRCALEFISKRSLQSHRQAAHNAPHANPRLYGDCQYCGKSFRRGMTLARHIKTHFAGPWTCDICEEFYSERYKLVLHMRQHTGNNPLVCYNCEEHFGDQEMLDQHERQCAMDAGSG